MAAASLSTLLWRAGASSRSFFALPTRPSASGRILSFSSSRNNGRSSSSSLAFQHRHSIAAVRRPIIATAFSNNGSSSSTSPRPSFSTHIKATSQTESELKKPIPIILLAGFLGSGKTSTLKHLLENKSNIKVGTIVNDVASVNIDAKLISNSDSQNDANINGGMMAEGVVELQNGCACCSLADELFTSVLKLTQNGERDLDAIVVELSGVADPVAVRDNWKQGELNQHPATALARLDRTVTLVDACTFGTDWLTWDVAGERDQWSGIGDDCSATRKVPELLAEQVEAADLLLINKIDLAGEKQVGVASGVARGLNGKASVMEVEFGRVGVRELLGELLSDEQEEEEHCSHDHGHHDHHDGSKCEDVDCKDESHSHSHSHSSEASCNEPDCTDTSHSHSHSHSSEDDCNDPDCTDDTHSHSHDHGETSTKTAANHLGITSFVYQNATPFNSQRLLALLNRWPVPIKDSLDFDLVMGMGTDKKLDENTKVLPEHQAFVGVLRSKGFCWMAPIKWGNSAGNDAWRHDTAMYWSHAGKHFGITSAGKWWGTLSKDQMKPYFANNPDEYERIMREDWVSEEWGDRRQELVFIGTNIDEDEIRAALDDCLCTEDEMIVYRAQVSNLQSAEFSDVGGPSLFDVGGVDHMDQ